ncbi:MAG: hypothetical protein AAFX85_19690, partial [Pseudomonadota bacterium]
MREALSPPLLRPSQQHRVALAVLSVLLIFTFAVPTAEAGFFATASEKRAKVDALAQETLDRL